MSGAAKWCRSSHPTRWCMRRATRRGVQIAGQFRHFPHQVHKAVVAADEKTCLALIFDWPAYFVASRKSVDIRTMFGQPREKVR